VTPSRSGIEKVGRIPAPSRFRGFPVAKLEEAEMEINPYLPLCSANSLEKGPLLEDVHRLRTTQLASCLSSGFDSFTLVSG
jgi:hypothetical protein